MAGVFKCSNNEKEEDAAEVQGHGMVDEAEAAPVEAPAASAALRAAEMGNNARGGRDGDDQELARRPSP